MSMVEPHFPLQIALAAFAVEELFLSKPVTGTKDVRDRGSFWLVWWGWYIALISNILLFLAFPAEPELVPLNASACLVCVGAAAARFFSKRILGRFYTMRVNIAQDHELITTGPYRIVRHPLYSSFAAFFAFLPLTQPSLAGIVLGELFGGLPVVLTLWFRIRVEETALSEKFGADWTSYAGRTWRVIPWLF